MDVRSLLLKAGATAITVGTLIASAAYVTSHLKNPSAPLRPVVLADSSATLAVGPSVRPSAVAPVTSTYAS